MDLSLGILIKVVKDQLTGWAQAAKNKLGSLGTSGTQAGASIAAGSKQAATGLKSVSKEAETATKQVGGLEQSFKRAAASLATIFTVKGILETADRVKTLEGRMKVATGSAAGMAAGMADVSRIADETGSALETIGDLYARLSRATKTLKVSQSEVAQVTELIAKSLAATGESGASAEAALIQLSQAFSSGTLRGEELNSVLEQAAGLAQVIADGLGVTTGKLRELGAEGKLTAEQVFRAIQRQALAINDTFGQMPETFGKAVNRVSNAWTEFIGEVDDSTGFSEKAAAALDKVADNMGAVASAAALAGASITAAWASATATGIGAMNAQLVAGASAANAAAAGMAAFKTAAAGVGAAALSIGGVATVLTGITFAIYSTATMLERVKGKFYESEIAAADARDRWREMADEAQNAAAELQKYASTRVASSEKIVRMTKEERENYRTSLNLAIAYNAEMLRAAIAQEAVGVNTKVAQEKARAEMERLRKAIKALNSDLGLTAKEIEKLTALPEAVREIVKEFIKLRTEGSNTADALKQIVATFDPKNFVGIRELGLALGELQADGKASAQEVGDAWDSALDKLTPTELLAFGKTAQQVFLYSARDAKALATVNDAILRKSLRGLGVDADVAFTGMSRAARDAVANLDVLGSNFLKLQERSGDAKKVLREAFVNAIDTANTVEAVQQIEDRIMAMVKAGYLAREVGDQMLSVLKVKAIEVRPEVDALAGAYKTLGITSQAEMKKTAEASRAAYEAIRLSGAPLEQQKQAWLAYAEAQIKANNGVANIALKAKASVLGLSGALDKITASSEASQRAVDSLRSTWERSLQAAQRNTDAVREHGTAMVAAAQQALENAKAQGDLLAIEEATVNVRKAEAKAAQDLATALQAEAASAWSNVAAMKEKAAADGDVNAAERELIENARQVAEELDKQAISAKRAAEAAKEAERAATAKKDEIRTASVDWASLAGSYGLAADKGGELAKIQAQMWAGMQRIYSTGFGSMDGYIDAMNAATERAAGFVKALDSVEDAARGGDETLDEYIRALQRAIRQGSLLGSEELRPLRDALRDAKERMRGLQDSARDTLNSLRDELDEMHKNYDEIEKRRYRARQAEIQAQIAIAKSAGNGAAVADLQRALVLLNQVSQERIKEAAAREREDRSLKAKEPLTTAQTQDRTVVKVVDINIKVGDDTGTAQVVEGGEEVIVDMLRKAQMVAS